MKRLAATALLISANALVHAEEISLLCTEMDEAVEARGEVQLSIYLLLDTNRQTAAIETTIDTIDYKPDKVCELRKFYHYYEIGCQDYVVFTLNRFITKGELELVKKPGRGEPIKYMCEPLAERIQHI